MIDVLVLLSDTPCEGGEAKTKKYFIYLRKILQKHLYQYQYRVEHVSSVYKKDKLKKSEIRLEQQRIFDLIEKTAPKVILAMGDVAFIALGMENTKITEICNIPQNSPFFNGNFIDKRTKKFRTAITVPERGLYIENKFALKLTRHNPLIYPTHKYISMLTHASGFKGTALFERQLSRIKEILAMPTFKRYTMSYYKHFVTMHYKPEHLEAARNSLKFWSGESIFSFDIETAGYQVPKEAQLDFNHAHAEITVIAIGNENHVDVYNTHHLPELIPLINEVFENKSKQLTWNGNFDIQFMKHLWNTNFDGHTHIDGMTCLYLTDMNVAFLGRGSRTLKSTSATFLENGACYAGYQKNAGIDVAIKNGDGDYLAKHEIDFMMYAGIDVLLTDKTVRKLWNGLSKKSRQLVTKYYPELTHTLNDIHKDGIEVDVDLLHRFMEDLENFLFNVEEAIVAKVDEISACPSGRPFTQGKFNPRSNAHVCEVAYDMLGHPPHTTDKGNYSVTMEILSAYAKNCDFCKLIIDYRSFRKQYEIFEAILKHTKGNKCYPFYNQYRTTSGRLTSTAPPIQIVPKNKTVHTVTRLEASKVSHTPTPKEILSTRPLWPVHKVDETEDGYYELVETSPNFKQIFKAEKDYTVIYADYSQLEIVVLVNYIAMVSQDKSLENAVRQGKDLHSFTASQLYSVLMNKKYSYEYIKAHKEEEPYKTWRQDSKSVIFKLIYGGSAYSMAREKNIPVEDASRIWDTFLINHYGIQDYMNYQKILSQFNFSVETFGGHTRDLSIVKYDRFNSKAKNIALNHPIQGTASYIVNQGMVKLDKEIRKLGPKARILLTVHDSICVQVPRTRVLEGMLCMQHCMEDYVNLNHPELQKFIKIPVKIDMEYGPNWHQLKLINLPETKRLRQIVEAKK